MTKYDVYGVGNALVDLEYKVTPDQLLELEIDKGAMTLVDEARQAQIVQRLGAQESNRGSGGSAANSMIAVSQLGGKSHYSCRVADDAMGEFYIQDLERAGVTAGATSRQPARGVTGKCLVLVTPDADRTMNTFLGASADISPDDIDESVIAQSKYVYVEGYLVTGPASQQAAMFAFDRARSQGVKLAFSLSDRNVIQYFRPAMNELIGDGVDLLFANEEEAMCLAETESLEDALKFLPDIAAQFVITCGSKGAVMFDGQTLHRIAPVPTDPIDTVGAGDMFAGAFLYGMTRGLTCQQSGVLASRAASRVVSRMGPRLTLEETLDVLKSFRQDGERDV